MPCLCGENGGKVGSKSVLGWITEVGAGAKSPVVGVPGLDGIVDPGWTLTLVNFKTLVGCCCTSQPSVCLSGVCLSVTCCWVVVLDCGAWLVVTVSEGHQD